MSDGEPLFIPGVGEVTIHTRDQIPEHLERMKNNPEIEGIIYCNEQAKGAWPNGTRIVKMRTQDGDGTAIGTKGTVMGSIGGQDGIEIGYFVMWDDLPPVPVLIMGWQLDLAG